MEKLLLILGLAFGLASPVSALDFDTDTRTLYKACKIIQGKENFTLREEDLFYAGQCLGAISTMKKVLGNQCMTSLYTGEKIKNAYHADTLFVSNVALVQAFLNYAQKRPQEWDKDSYFIIAKSFEEYWPCEN